MSIFINSKGLDRAFRIRCDTFCGSRVLVHVFGEILPFSKENKNTDH